MHARTLFAAAMALATAPASAAPAAPSPILGRWELDLARLPADYGAPPARVLYTFEDVGAGAWRISIDVTAPDGTVRHMAVQARRDGRGAASEGDLGEGDHAALVSPAPDTMVMSIAKDRGLASVRTYTISADGREMTEAAADVDAAGAPYVRTFHFRRVS